MSQIELMIKRNENNPHKSTQTICDRNESTQCENLINKQNVIHWKHKWYEWKWFDQQIHQIRRVWYEWITSQHNPTYEHIHHINMNVMNDKMRNDKKWEDEREDEMNTT